MGRGYYPFAVGTLDCVAISDGTFRYPASTIFVNAPQERLGRALGAHGLAPDQITTSYTCLVINAGRQRVLVDTGAGGLAPSTGRLLYNLRAAGITPGDIDTVILSHGHPEHIGGATGADGRPTFPNARYVMWKDEWAFWTSEARLVQVEELLASSARSHLPALRWHLDLLDDHTEILPGIQAVAAPGHTPGHMAVKIVSGHEQLLYSADTALHPLHLAYPDWYPSFDLEHAQAVTTKHQLFTQAAADRALVLGFHFPFPGLGRVTPRKRGWQWHPIESIPYTLAPGAPGGNVAPEG